MSITQGGVLPDITQTTTTEDKPLDYYTDYLTALSGAGTTGMAAAPSAMIAGLDPLQTAGYTAVTPAATAYTPGLLAAETTAGQAAKGIDPSRINALMNPYTHNVTDEMARLSQQNMQRNVMPGLKAGFVGSGGLGSQRYANALGQSLADVQSNLTGQQYGALSSGYTQAQNAALQEAQLMNQVAQTQAKLAADQQSLGLTGAGALTKAGAEQQAYKQSFLDYPMKAATNASGLMRGFTVPNKQISTFKGPKAGSYETSDLANIMSVLSLMGGAGGKGVANISNMTSDLWNKFFPGQSSSTGGGSGGDAENQEGGFYGNTGGTNVGDAENQTGGFYGGGTGP